MAKIQYDDKETFRTSSLPEKNKVTAANMTEIKNSVNWLYDNQPTPPPADTPTLQEVTDEGDVTTNDITVGDPTVTATIVGTGGMGGLAGGVPTWATDDASGAGYFSGGLSDSEGTLRPLKKVVQISAAEIETIGDNPVDLLSSLGATSQFYDVEKVIIILRPGDTSFPNNERINIYGAFTVITESILSSVGEPIIYVLNSSTLPNFDDGGTTYAEAKGISANNSFLRISTYTGDNPGAGTGTIDVEVYYRIKHL